MGRPKELTEEQRADLLARGYRPVEVWVPDSDSPAFLALMERECRTINESDNRSGELASLSELVDDLWED